MPKGIPKSGVNKGWFKKGVPHPRKGCLTYVPCVVCSVPVIWRPSRQSKFCSHSCATKHRWKTGCLKPHGKEPWNKGLYGIHLSQDTEFKYKGKGDLLKGKSPQYWRQQARRVVGLVKGDPLIVHHIDGGITNNHPSNLMTMDRGEHTKLHHDQGDLIGGGQNF